MDLSDYGFRLHPFQPYPELEGFWSFSTLLENDWSAQSITYASVRPNRNTVDFQLVLSVGSSGQLITSGNWPDVLRPHATTRRIVTIDKEIFEMQVSSTGIILLAGYTPSLEGKQLLGEFTIPRKAFA